MGTPRTKLCLFFFEVKRRGEIPHLDLIRTKMELQLAGKTLLIACHTLDISTLSLSGLTEKVGPQSRAIYIEVS
jgi:hypothetical protein